MNTRNVIPQTAIIALALTGSLVVSATFADGKTSGLGGANPTATQDTKGGTQMKDGKGRQIEVESFSWGSTNNSQNKPKPGNSSAPTESMSLNYGKIKTGAAPASNDIKSPSSEPKPAGLLVPAVQKVRLPAGQTGQDKKEEIKKK